MGPTHNNQNNPGGPKKEGGGQLELPHQLCFNCIRPEMHRMHL